MATQVNQMPGIGGRTPLAAYPWDQWLDGRSWHLRRGTSTSDPGDYRVATTAMRAYVYRMAHRRGMDATTVRDANNGGITIQARRRPPAFETVES